VQPYLSVEETMTVFGSYYPAPLPVGRVLDLVGLTGQAKTRVKRLSGGQQRRLDVAIGLIGDPELLFLDEPTTGFDPEARRGAWEMVQGLQQLGKTILLTTHYMEEAQHLAGRVAIIQRGKIVAEGSPQALINQQPQTMVKLRRTPEVDALVTGLEARRSEENGYLVFETSHPTALLYELTRRARDQGIELPDLSVSRPTLEDAYLRLVSDNGEASE
jgi:ABC-2 type transport system ATP-binding protein